MSGQASGDETLPLRPDIVTTLEADAVHLTYDEHYLYAACRDRRVRVFSKSDWEPVAVLGETSSPPSAVHVDEEQVFATCEKRVYVWRKGEFGMIGWFELSYQAITSTLQGDRFYVGASEGRLVSIKKDTHETSSWQLHKADLTTLWSDDEVICTSAKKEAPVVWKHATTSAPTEIAQLDKEKGVVASGNNEYIIIGTGTGEIKIWDRVEWKLVNTLVPTESVPVASIWSTYPYLVVASAQSYLTIWDLTRGTEVGQLRINGVKFEWAIADREYVYAASSDGIIIIRVMLDDRPHDLMAEEVSGYGATLLRTSPYDVLEEVLILQARGDELFQQSQYPESVTEFENALQLLIDNTHALMEVPDERQRLTTELNTRLGRALLRSKIGEIKKLSEEVEQLSDELDMKGRTAAADDEVKALWTAAARALKEARVLAEAQADNILSYQLSHIADGLEADLEDAKAKLGKFQEKVNQALALTHSIGSEWRWMERRRTSLEERRGFLERAMVEIEERLKEADDDSEVEGILSSSLDEYRGLFGQISRIIEASDDKVEADFTSREEALAAIEGLLGVMAKRKAEIFSMTEGAEQKAELDRLVEAIQQALNTATRFKLKSQTRDLTNELNALLKDSLEPEEDEGDDSDAVEEK
ncbi:MAG: hypothetical protein JSW61_04410 [Candidatus Thorarchaeota archaeon]|nr:MAG: hypothetical protein JSW61_04410 [Candidatus Thorarchaeota archaeon]